jgi:5-bromo-4-chloroindolyl phosphate hydrolysis protein
MGMDKKELKARVRDLKRAPITPAEQTARRWVLGSHAGAALFLQFAAGNFLSNALSFVWIGLLVGLFVTPRNYLRWVAPITVVTTIGSLPGILNTDTSGLLVLVGLVAVFALNKRVPMWWVKRQEAQAEKPTAIDVPAGMSKRDFAFFKSELDTATQRVNHIERTMQKYGKTRQINTEYRTTVYASATLDALRKKPLKLTSADEFINLHLPNLEALLDTYVSIAEMPVHDDADYRRAENAREAMKALSVELKDDYRTIIADDLDDLDEQIEMAKFATRKDEF